MTTKLELVMSRREAAEKKADDRRRKAEVAKEKKEQRNNLNFERTEFKRLFKRLQNMVDGQWDRYGHGWHFKYKGGDFYIAYDSWFSAKTPGDVDDYDMSGSHWVLKLGFNGIQGREITLDHDSQPKGDLTDEVMSGLRELGKKFAKANGQFYGEDGEEED